MATKFKGLDPEVAAEELLASTWEGRGLPILPSYIARQVGAEVYDMALTDDVDGMLKLFEGGDTPCIFVQENARPTRKRFTVAHELGHLVLQRRFPDDVPDVDVFLRNQDSTTAKEPIEVFANQFAAALLMPRRFVEALIAANKSDLVMASDFGVSLTAMQHRLTNLKLKATPTF